MGRLLLHLHQNDADLDNLQEWLSEDHHVIVADPDAGLENEFDLCVLDEAALNRMSEKIKAEKKAASPVHLPFLLIASRRDVEAAARPFLQAVDELIFTPIDEAELKMRVKGLLRTRKLSAEVQKSGFELAEKAPVGILLLQETVINYANPAFCEMTGKSLAEVREMDFLHLLHPDDRAQAALSCRDASAATLLDPFRTLRLLTQKDPLWVELRLNALNRDSSPTILATVIEVAGRVVKEKSLQAALEYTENIVQTVREPMLVLDSDLRVISANQSFYETFQVGVEETRGRLLYELGNRQWDIPQLKRLLSQILAEQTTMEDFEVEHHFPSIGRRNVLLNARRICSENSGHPDLILLAIEDITQRKDLENLLKEVNQQLQAKLAEVENANEELSQFAYVTSHDLKAPLRAIHNYADFLREDLEETLDGEQLEYLQGLTLAVKQGEALIDDLLAFSRIGKARQTMERIDLKALVSEMRKSFESAEDVEITMADRWPVIETKKTLLRQVLWNLTSNAVKFNTSGKRYIELGWQPGKEGFIDLYVRDDGIGIDPAYHDKIFRIFQRLHTREEFEGTGIGLAIVRKAVKLMGGSIRVESRVGGGSTFWVTLPITNSGV